MRKTAWILGLVTIAAAVAPEDAIAERTVHSLIHDRARAHRYIDGHRVVSVLGADARVFRTPRTKGSDWTVPAPGVAAIHVRWRATGAKPAVRATLNGELNVPMPKLDADAQGGLITGLLAEALAAGEHRVRLSTTRAEVEWFALGPATPPNIPVAPPALPGALPTLFDGGGLAIPAKGKLVFHTMPPAGARLDLTVRGGPASIRISDGRSDKAVTPGTDLSAYADRPIRLEFEAGASPITLLDPRFSLASATPKPQRPAQPVKHVLIWLVDTLRPDHLPVYNPKTRVKAPNFDRLAKEGVTFDSCMAQGNESLSSHATLFSGQYPVVHRLTTPKRRLNRDLVTMPEAAQKTGMRTAGFISNGYVSERWGFGDGWNDYKNFIREGVPSQAQHVWRYTRKFLNKQGDKRTFSYLGTIDPHVAYNAPEPFQLQYATAPYNGRLRPQATGVFLDKWKANGKKPALTEADQQFMLDLYDGEISYNDHILGKLLAWLDKKGRTQDTAVIILADHGEEFFEHGNVGHGHTTRQVLTHIPCMVRWPGGLPAGKRVRADVELMDFFPTIIDLAGGTIPPTVQGESLVSLMSDPAPATPRPAFTFHGGVRAAKLGRWKYVLLSNRERLYDLTEDPDERTNVADSHPLALRLLRETMAVHFALNTEWKKREHGHPNSPTAAGAKLIGTP